MKVYKIIEKGKRKSDGEIYLNLREENLIRKLKKALNDCLVSIKNNLTPEITVECLREAINEIDYLTGRKYNDEILEKIFSNFCIGK